MSRHPGFPPKYWEMLAKAAQEMDKVDACEDCMTSWRSHGPGHYRAFQNIGRCTECAVRAALPVERAVLDWQYEHDPLKILVKKVVVAFRKDDDKAFSEAVEELHKAVPKDEKEEGA